MQKIGGQLGCSCRRRRRHAHHQFKEFRILLLLFVAAGLIPGEFIRQRRTLFRADSTGSTTLNLLSLQRVDFPRDASRVVLMGDGCRN